MCSTRSLPTLLLALGLSIYVFGQDSEKTFNAGLKAGLNTSQMTGDGYTGFYTLSPVVGVFGNSQLNDQLRLQYEILYQNKGSKDPAQPDKGKYNSYKIRLGYVEVPFLFQYELKKFLIEAGPGIGFLVHSKEWDQNGVNKGNSFDWRKFELDAMLGANYFFVEDHFFVNVRAHHSMTSVVSTTAVTPYGTFGGAWNIVLALTLNYQF
jgi:hypothetical protein